MEEEGGTLDLIRSSLREQILFYQVSNISVSKGEQSFFLEKIAVLGIRDILLRIGIRIISLVTLGCKKIFFFLMFFSYNLPAGILTSALNLLL